MKAKKNIFGQYIAYESPVLSDSDKIIVTGIINNIADGIQSQIGREEFITEVKNKQAVLQYIVGIINSYLPSSIERVDGKSISTLVDTVIQSRVDGYYVTVAITATGDGELIGGRFLKGENVELDVTGDVISCSTPIIDGKITFNPLTENVSINIVFTGEI